MSIKKLINTASWERGISYSMDGGYFTEGVTTDKRTVIVKHDTSGKELEAWIGECNTEEHYLKAPNGWSRNFEHTPGY